MNTQTASESRDYGFALGLLTGTCVGAGLMMWLAPRMTSEVRQRMTAAAKDLSTRASDQYDQASARVGDAVDEITRRGQGVRDVVADTVARGAREVERVATAAKADR
jgi:gas vesicle protein